MKKMKRVLLAFFVLVFFRAGELVSNAALSCPEGFNLETNAKGEQNCRNSICDSGLNLYGEYVDTKGASLPQPYDFYGGIEKSMKDFSGMPRPKVKGPDGKWVGWSAGAIQCPPDKIGLHPNPDWPCGFDYCLSGITVISSPVNFIILEGI